MGDTLRTVHRIRKVEERVAQVAAFAADDAAWRSATALATTEAHIAASWEVAHDNVVAMWGHHAEALRLELRRRAQARDLADKDRIAEQARARVRVAATEARVMERAANARDEAANQVMARAAQANMEEAGLQSWWRRSA
jgi:hypothetical protein